MTKKNLIIIILIAAIAIIPGTFLLMSCNKPTQPESKNELEVLENIEEIGKLDAKTLIISSRDENEKWLRAGTRSTTYAVGWEGVSTLPWQGLHVCS